MLCLKWGLEKDPYAEGAKLRNCTFSAGEEDGAQRKREDHSMKGTSGPALGARKESSENRKEKCSLGEKRKGKRSVGYARGPQGEGSRS